jgi:hypothetical protein
MYITRENLKGAEDDEPTAADLKSLHFQMIKPIM